MKSYIIGRIDGLWDNFLPPIQGGTFRHYNGEEDDANGTIELSPKTVPIADTQIDSGSSRPSSPSLSLASSDELFLDPSLRRRHVESSSSSITSVSVVDEQVPVQFNARYLTRKGIEEDLAKYPSLDCTTQREIAQKYRALEVRIRDAGLYNCNYWAYGREVIRYIILFFGCMLCLKYGWYKTSAFLLGCFWHQLVFSAHDAGHMGITHNFQIDTGIGIIIANFLGGLSLGWWKRSHNVGRSNRRVLNHLLSCARFIISSRMTPSTILILSIFHSLPSVISSSRVYSRLTTTV